MKRNPVILLLLIFTLVPVSLSADFNTVLDTIYAQETAPLRESVWLVLAGAEIISHESDLSAADSYMADKSWSMGSSLSAGQLAVLLMDNFDLPKGLMYRITGAPRYAVKDLKYYGLISGGIHINQMISGYELVNSLTAVLEEDRS